MTPEEIKFRRCSVPDCTYKELRGSSLGAFWAGKFVCDDCYADLALADPGRPVPKHGSGP